MGAILGTTGTLSVQKPVKIKRVTVTAGVGGASVLSIAPYNGAATDAKILVSTIASQTTQAQFDGLLFSSGLTVIPDGNTSSYIVEYDE